MSRAGDGPTGPPRDVGRSPADRATLALLLEVAATPKPGCVDRERDHPDMRFEHFLAGATGARPGLAAATAGERLGAAFERAVAGMAAAAGRNTQFGALLLLAPLVRAAAADGDSVAGPTTSTATAAAEATTVADAADFYRAFEHVDVFAGEPPDGAAELDVRRGADAVPAVEERGVTLHDVMALAADRDGVAAEWTGGFERTFDAADRLGELSGPLSDRAARAFLELLAAEPDTLVARRHGEERAREVANRAEELLDDEGAAGGSDAVPVHESAAVSEFADDLVAAGVNPGTTADLLAGGLFVALERGAVSL